MKIFPMLFKIVSARHGNIRLISLSDLNEFRENSEPQIFVDSSTSYALIADDGVGVDELMVEVHCRVLNMKMFLPVLCERLKTALDISKRISLIREFFVWKQHLHHFLLSLMFPLHLSFQSVAV